MHKPAQSSSLKPRTAARLLVDALAGHGLRHAFGVPGESYLAVLDALRDSPIDFLVCRQEGGAAMMAEAVGKLTGKPGLCFVTRGPGSDEREQRRARRAAGFFADAAVRRQRGARVSRTRSLPGNRHRGGVRQHGEVGGRDHRCGARARGDRPRSSRRDARPARSGRDLVAGGHADRGGECSRSYPDRSRGNLARAR